MRVALHVVRGVGHVALTPETHDDMYAVFSLVAVGDCVRASTVRKVLHESSAGGAATAERVRTWLTVRVVDVVFDPELGEVRATGVNAAENRHVKGGAFHTLELELHRPLEVHKDAWDAGELDALRTLAGADAAAAGATLFAVMLDEGAAQVVAVTPAMSLVRARVDVALPKKRGGSERHEAARARFFDAAFDAMVRAVDWAAARVIVLASPGFVKDDFFAHAMAVAGARGLKAVLDARPRFVLAHAAAGHKRALAATLADPAVAARVGDARAAGEGALLARFHEVLARDAERAQYGWRHVRAALDAGAVEALLVCDELTRARDARARRDALRLLADARAGGVAVSLLSSLHVSGEALHGLGGVAAILRYAVHGLDEAARAVAPIGKGAGAGADGGGGGDGEALALGHRVQAATLAAPATADADSFARGGFDTASDRSEDSDE